MLSTIIYRGDKMATWRNLKLKSVTWLSLLTITCLLSFSTAWAQEDSVDYWPQEIETNQGVVVVYQPQPEKLEGNKLSGLAAVAVELTDKEEPVFGAIWFEARLDTDRDERIATITDVTITDVRFPAQDENKADKLKTLLEEEMPKWNMPISMDRLLATLELAETRSKATQKINTDPPKIIFMTEPAVLITLDGKERLQEIESSKLKRVINTPFTIIFHTSKKTYYLYADKDTWYTASNIKGDWTIAKTVPSEIAALGSKEEAELAPKEKMAPEDQVPKEEDVEPGPPPKVVVATEPTELISSNGEPEFAPLTGTELLYMSNTDSDVLMDNKKQEYYVLLSGRWFMSKKMEGPWKYIPGDNLPEDFAKIPEDSEMGTVLYAVPGTDIAKEAVLDAQFPQTATVDRKKKISLELVYDGEPKFQTITGTKMAYAINTDTPVIRLDGKYYACQDAIWFESKNAKFSWNVATSIPDTIYTIPPESPIYNVTYVRIYDSTPDVVYVGYTPGYTNTYVYNNTIVYGTGYWCPGWYGKYYYPCPATWGYHARWNPWIGWGYGFSYGYGPYHFSIGYGRWYRGGWWGPGRYHNYRHGYRHGRRAGYRHGLQASSRAGYRASSRNSGRSNMYRSQRNQARTRAQPAAAHNRQTTKRASSNRANNLYADKNGNVNRKTGKGWEQRTNKGWESKDRASQTQQQQVKQRQAQQQQAKQRQAQQQRTRQQQTQQLDRSHQARQRGNKRASSYNKSRSSGSRGGGGRGGGRR